jgi:nucleoside-triphosphatase THEP1
MVLRIALTGSPGVVGKSTLIMKSVECARCRVGGVLARDKRIKDRRVGFELLDLGTGATGMLADVTGTGPQLGKYRVRLDDLGAVGAKAVESPCWLSSTSGRRAPTGQEGEEDV